MKIYLSGPMTGLADFNKPAFDEAARFYRAFDFEVVNPAEVELPEGEASWVNYMRADIKLLVDCQGVVMLAGWEASAGAKLERDIALGLGLQVTEDKALRDCLGMAMAAEPQCESAKVAS